MKKLILLFLFAGLVLNTTSCTKEKECPTPEGPWAVGTWNATKVVDNGQEADSSDPAIACLLQNVITLNESGSGNWEYHLYSNGNCGQVPLVIEYWLENKAKKKLLVHFTANGNTYDVPFDYTDNTHFRYYFDPTSYVEFTKQ